MRVEYNIWMAPIPFTIGGNKYKILLVNGVGSFNTA